MNASSLPESVSNARAVLEGQWIDGWKIGGLGTAGHIGRATAVHCHAKSLVYAAASQVGGVLDGRASRIHFRQERILPTGDSGLVGASGGSEEGPGRGSRHKGLTRIIHCNRARRVDGGQGGRGRLQSGPIYPRTGLAHRLTGYRALLSIYLENPRAGTAVKKSLERPNSRVNVGGGCAARDEDVAQGIECYPIRPSFVGGDQGNGAQIFPDRFLWQDRHRR